ncbi:MAG: hypothetical protein DGJ47_001060, partial [Rickettsiaceae bacterium]
MSNVGKAEILQIIDSVSRERNVPKAKLIEAMESAVEMAGRKKYGQERKIIAKINVNTGKVDLFMSRTVVKDAESFENDMIEILLEDALLINQDAKVGEEVLEPLPPIELGRVSAQIAKQVIVQQVGDAERENQYEAYKERKGDVINGVVKRIEAGNIIVDLGRAEAYLHRSQQIRGERYSVGDRVKAYVQDVRKESRGAQIFLSRTDDKFLAKLFETEVPEIYDGAVEIKALSREPGSKAKVAVYASDVSLDPVSCCVGVRGNRVRAITEQLSGEKIDVINWDKDIVQFAINAMTPATITKIVFNEEKRKLETIVPESQLSLAIGRRGQNVRLASKITGWIIDVMTEEQESTRRKEEFTNSAQSLMQHLDIDEVMAQLLSVEGFGSVEQVAYAETNNLASIEGFSDELAQEVQNRALTHLESQNEQIIEDLEKLGVEQDLLDMLDLPAEYILKLAEFGVKTVEDLAEVTENEVKSVVPVSILPSEHAAELIKLAKQ